MLEPMQVARITQSMLQLLAAKGLRELPVTVKCRLGVDRFDSYDFIRNFIEVVSTYGGVTHFIIHARKAFLVRGSIIRTETKSVQARTDHTNNNDNTSVRLCSHCTRAERPQSSTESHCSAADVRSRLPAGA